MSTLTPNGWGRVVSLSLAMAVLLALPTLVRSFAYGAVSEEALAPSNSEPLLHPHLIRFAQSDGAIGGTLKKRKVPQNKTTRKKTSTTNAPAKQRSGACRTVVGSWSWTIVSVTITAVFRSNGTASTSNGLTGKWTCTGGAYTVQWRPFGVIDRFTVSRNGTSLSGRSTLLGGRTIAARRQ